jgi:hypothetical protein
VTTCAHFADWGTLRPADAIQEANQFGAMHLQLIAEQQSIMAQLASLLVALFDNANTPPGEAGPGPATWLAWAAELTSLSDQLAVLRNQVAELQQQHGQQ